MSRVILESYAQRSPARLYVLPNIHTNVKTSIRNITSDLSINVMYNYSTHLRSGKAESEASFLYKVASALIMVL